jgi:hypothetical protein
MKVTVVLCTLLVLAVSVGATDRRKVDVYIGWGVTIPTGDAGDRWKVGFHGRGGVGLPIGPGLQLIPTTEYHSLSLDKQGLGATGGALSVFMLGVNGKISFSLERQKTTPYMIGGLGMGITKIASAMWPGYLGPNAGRSESKVYFDFGWGVDVYAGESSSIFVELRYVSVSTSRFAVTYLPFSVGMRF